MPPKMKIDDLIEAFSDTKVAQAIAAAIMPHIRDCLTGIVKDEMDKFTTQLQTVRDEQSSQNQRINELVNENAILRRQLDGLDADGRLTSLVVRGLPEKLYSERSSGTAGTA